MRVIRTEEFILHLSAVDASDLLSEIDLMLDKVTRKSDYETIEYIKTLINEARSK